jgi:hypothetical protein
MASGKSTSTGVTALLGYGLVSPIFDEKVAGTRGRELLLVLPKSR